MGSTCSMSRQRDGHVARRRRTGNILMQTTTNSDRNDLGARVRRCLRHSVVSAIPDGSIASLYPIDDNYINVGQGLRSPKSLAELASDALCRSLALLDGELPAGLPQDVVDDIVHSLINHSALNATTLRVMKNCELGTLSLAKCRGVTDAWLEPLSHVNTTASPSSTPPEFSRQDMDLEDDAKTQDIFYGTFSPNKFEESSCSTSSFVSATSKHAPEDHIMTDVLSSESFLSANNKITPVEGMLLHEDALKPSRSSNLSDSSPEDGVPASSPLSSWDAYQLEQNQFHLHHHHFYPQTCRSVTSNLTLLDLRGSQHLTDRGLLQLTDLSSLEVARLDHCHFLTGRGLLAFSNSHRLHTLSLANCRRLTDEAVINISHLMSLEALSLDGCRCLTDRSLAAIADLYGLRKLDLSQCDLITDGGLEQLENLEMLTELSLGWCRQISDAGIGTLTSQPGRDQCLRVLRLARCSIQDEGATRLGRLLALEELDLNGCSGVGSVALGKSLERLKNLTTLDVSYCPGIL